jgi:flagellar biosynthetic protein FliR
MMAELAELLALTQNALWLGFAVFLRVGALVALMPGFGERSVPGRVKLALALVFVIVIAPAAPPPPVLPDLGGVVHIVLTETLAGVALGLGMRLFIMGLQTAGSIAAQSTSLSQILGGAVADPLPAMGYFLIIGALALAMITGLHVKAAALLIASYDLLPMGQWIDGAMLSRWGVAQVQQAFSMAFTLAAPFVVLSVIYNLTLGVINKAMPQLMVAFVGAPVITAGGLLILFLAAPLILEAWLAALDQFLVNPARISP